jgi:acyl-CoA thioesterase
MTGGPSFDDATAVRPYGEGAYRGFVRAEWDGPLAPNGGHLAAIVLRAMLEESSDSSQAPRSLALQFIRPAHHGELEIAVECLRRGRRITHLASRARQGGKLVLTSLASFGAPDDSAMQWKPDPPPLQDPQSVAPLEPAVGSGAPPMMRHVDMRPMVGPGIFSGSDEAAAGGWVSLRQPRKVDALLLCAYSDIWWPAAFGRVTQPIGVPTLDHTVHFRTGDLPREPEPVFARFRSRLAREGFLEEDGELWSIDGELLAHSRQLALLFGTSA